MAKKKMSKSIRRVNPLSSPAAQTVYTRTGAPRTRTLPNGNTLVCNKEYVVSLGQLNAADALLGFGINPCDTAIFNWLPGDAKRFAYYRFRKLRVMYTSNCPNTQRGSVVLGAFYDFADYNNWFNNIVGSKYINLTNTQGSCVGNVWASSIKPDPRGGHRSEIMIDFDVAKAHMRTPWYICAPNTEATVTALDNQAVCAYLGVATSPSGIGTVSCGDIQIEYEVEFCHPVPNLPTYVPVLRDGRGFDRGEQETYNPWPIPTSQNSIAIDDSSDKVDPKD